MLDDRGTAYSAVPPRRVVSLVPSLTEAIAATVAGLLVGATDWCTHPAGLDVVRVGGTKYPDLDRVGRWGPTWWSPTRRRTGTRMSLRCAPPGSRCGSPPRRRARRWTPWPRLCACSAGEPGWLAGARGLGRPAAAARDAGGGPDLAPAVDGARPGHVRRRRAGPARRRQPVRGPPSAIRARDDDPRRAPPTWWCCPTSRTRSPPTTARRPCRRRARSRERPPSHLVRPVAGRGAGPADRQLRG